MTKEDSKDILVKILSQQKINTFLLVVLLLIIIFNAIPDFLDIIIPYILVLVIIAIASLINYYYTDISVNTDSFGLLK